MIQFKNVHYSPGQEHEKGNNTVDTNEGSLNTLPQNPENKKAGKKQPSFLEKIKKALQDWSNKDERDFKYDDTKV